jgi:hypothetical protein
MVGYNQFVSKATGISDTYWFNFSLDIRGYLKIDPCWILYAGIGPGMYKPETGTNELGGNAGIGVNYRYPLPNIVFELGMDIHLIFDPDIQFLHLHAGIISEF